MPTLTIDPIQELLNEHKDVVQELEILEEHLHKLETKTEFEEQERKTLTDWLDIFEKHINLHIDKEDNVLFTALEKYIPKQGGPLAVMEIEHRGVEAHIETFKEGIRNGIELRPGTLNAFCENGFEMIDLLHSHLGKEEQILFPMANQVLTQEEKDAIGKRYEELNRKANT